MNSRDNWLLAPQYRPSCPPKQLLSLPLVPARETEFNDSQCALFEVSHIVRIVAFKEDHVPLTMALKRSEEDRDLHCWRVTLDPRHVAGKSDVDIVLRSEFHVETIACAGDGIQVSSC